MEHMWLSWFSKEQLMKQVIMHAVMYVESTVDGISINGCVRLSHNWLKLTLSV